MITLKSENKVIQNKTVSLNTSSYTLKDIKEEANECKKILTSLGYDQVNKNSYIFGYLNSVHTLGRTKLDSRSSTVYTILINKNYLKNASPEEIHNTIMHEMIHSIDPDHMNHGELWKQTAKEVNEYYTYSKIQRIEHLSLEQRERYFKNKYKYKLQCKHCGNAALFTKKCKTLDYSTQGKVKCLRCNHREFDIIDL